MIFLRKCYWRLRASVKRTDQFQFSSEIWCSHALIAGGRHERAWSRR